MLEIENELNHNHLLRKPFMSLDTAHLFPESLLSTVGCLICLWELGDKGDNTYICNPITKEYMILPKQQFDVDTYWDLQCGFGVSATGEYKVIRFWRMDPFRAEVYTLGTDKWRTLGQVPYHPPDFSNGLFYNNHVHWIVASNQLFSFNLDDETFQLFPLPSSLEGNLEQKSLGVLKGCLGLFSKSNSEARIWVMKENGIEKSWHKELEIKQTIIPSAFPEGYPESVIDGLNGRSIVFFTDTVGEEEPCQLFAYCLETNTIEETTIFDNLFRVINYRPSFLKLENFHPARVHLF